MNRLYLLFLFPLLSTGCGVVTMTVDVYKPPLIDLPADVKRIGVINRAVGTDRTVVDEIVAEIVSGEGNYSDYLGAQQCVLGLIDFLEYSEEFSSVTNLKINFPGVNHSELPPPLGWEYVGQLSALHGLDAIIAVESISARHEVGTELYSARKQEEKNKVWTNRVLYSVEFNMRHLASLKVNMNTGWRIYHYPSKRILDEIMFSDSVLWEMDGSTAEEAVLKLPGRGRAVEEGGFFMGEQYGTRVVPGWNTVQRQFYRPYRPEFRSMARDLKMRKWGNLLEKYFSLMGHPDPVVRGMVLHNLAVIHEMEGKIDLAVDQCSQAAMLIQAKRTREYLETLKEREKEFTSGSLW